MYIYQSSAGSVPWTHITGVHKTDLAPAMCVHGSCVKAINSSLSTGNGSFIDFNLANFASGLHSYKIQLAQEFKVNDHSLFANRALYYLEEDLNFGRKIFFTDESHFCTWYDANPH